MVVVLWLFCVCFVFARAWLLVADFRLFCVFLWFPAVVFDGSCCLGLFCGWFVVVSWLCCGCLFCGRSRLSAVVLACLWLSVLVFWLFRGCFVVVSDCLHSSYSFVVVLWSCCGGFVIVPWLFEIVCSRLRLSAVVCGCFVFVLWLFIACSRL